MDEQKLGNNYLLVRHQLVGGQIEFILMNYHQGRPDILNDPESIVVSKSIRELAREREALLWGTDIVVAYDGPPIAKGNQDLFYAVTQEDLFHFLLSQPID